MWLSKKLNEDTRDTSAAALRGAVTMGGAEAAVWSCGEERNLPAAAPGGYAWRPRFGENVLVLKGGETGGERYIVGALEEDAEALGEGEICLYSAGGTKLYLRNDGRIELFGALYINGELYINGAPYVRPTEGV